MIRRRFTIGVVGLALVGALGTGCGRSENLSAEVTGYVTRAQRESLAYEYSESAERRNVQVKGTIEDSIRHSETMAVNGETVMERVVHDDLLALQVRVPDQLPQLAAPEPADVAVAEALRTGGWVIDPSGAPPEGAAGAQGIEVVGADPLADAASVFQYTRLAITQAVAVAKFTPEATDYILEDDPFPRPNKARGEERFDVFAPPLPRREGETLPGPASFRKMAIYVVKGRLSRILEQIDIDDQPEIKRARQTGRNKFLLKLANDVKTARAGQRIRERKMQFEIVSRGKRFSVKVPPEGFAGNLRVLFGPKTTDTATANADQPGPTSTTSPPIPAPAPGATPPVSEPSA